MLNISCVKEWPNFYENVNDLLWNGRLTKEVIVGNEEYYLYRFQTNRRYMAREKTIYI